MTTFRLLLLPCLFCLCSSVAWAQNAPVTVDCAVDQLAFNTTNKLAGLCYAWGLLKYNHPEVAKGLRDWDKVLLEWVPRIENSSTEKSYHEQLQALFSLAGKIKKNNAISPITRTNVFKNNTANCWEEFDLYPKKIKKELQQLLASGNLVKNDYVQFAPNIGNPVFKKEKTYDQLAEVDKGHRLLALFRYWNVINYFYPYKYSIGKDWNQVLLDHIPQFVQANSDEAYYQAVLSLTASIGDGHVHTVYPKMDSILFRYFADFKLIYTGGQFVVEKIYVAEKHPLKEGDVLKKMDGRLMESIADSLKKYYRGANELNTYRMISQILLSSPQEHHNFVIERAGKLLNLNSSYLSRAAIGPLMRKAMQEETKTVYKTYQEGKTGYLQVSQLRPTKFTEAFKSRIDSTSALIIDLRGYPRGVMNPVCDFLFSAPTSFFQYTQIDPKSNGTLLLQEGFKVGKDNPAAYQGQVIILVNEQTQSHAEFFTMALQKLPNVQTVGSQTAGSDGNVSRIGLPGGIKTSFSGLGIYYPNGAETQRVGVRIDHLVKRMPKDILDKKDPILEKALELLR